MTEKEIKEITTKGALILYKHTDNTSGIQEVIQVEDDTSAKAYSTFKKLKADVVKPKSKSKTSRYHG